MTSRAALALLVVLLASVAAEASNYRKYNDPTWGGRWKQTLRTKEVRIHPYIAAH